VEKSLYIHIPFCRKKCDYCDFFSVPCKGNIPDEYISALKNEISFLKDFYKISSWRTVYIGGGTPSLLTEKQIGDLCSFLAKDFSSDNGVKNIAEKEFTIEMNPDDIRESLLDVAYSSGVNRLSIGVQSLNDAALKAVNRRCTRETTLKALELVKKNWCGSLSLDAIAGLPEQNTDEFLQSLKEIVSYEPSHISLYSLMIEEGTPLFSRISKGELLYNEDESEEQWLLGKSFLTEKDFLQYEVSNFAIKGKESKHNSVYWHLEDYLGAGSGATGSLFGDNAIRWTNTADIKKYIEYWTGKENKSILTAPRENENLDMETQEEEFLMMGFRLLSGVSEREYKKRFSKDLGERLGAKDGVFAKWQSRGDARIIENANKNGERFYALTDKGILFLNKYLEEIL